MTITSHTSTAPSGPGGGAPEAVEPAEFRSLMADFPTGVAVVTAIGAGGRPWGMTCSSVCSVSLHPPTLLICLRQGSVTLAALLDHAAFAVNFLHDRARGVAELFASGAADRFDRVTWAARAAGPGLPEAAHAVADCRVVTTESVGDHIVVFGEVFGVEQTAGDRPLLYGRRRYAAFPGPLLP
jgi:flavin reductase (DIM6/NTAB) family NADH-FMN oxidoreductase RutF